MSAFLEQINAFGSRFFEFAGPMLIQASLLVLIILSLDFLLRKRVRAVFRYWLWMLVLVKLVLPASLATPVSLGNWFGDEIRAAKQVLPPPVPFDWVAPQAQSPALLSPPAIAPAFGPPLPIESETVAVDRAYSPPPVEAVRLTTEGFLFLGWLIVALAMALWLLRRTVFARAVVAQSRDAEGWMNDALDSCRRLMGMKRRVRFKVSASAASPAVCGLLCPTILIPEHLAPKLTGGGLRAILLHELAHIQRGDLWVNLAQTVLQTLYFYNPLVWLANAMINRVREQAVDEAVLVALGAEARDEYLDTLVRVARTAFRQPAPSLRLLGVVESKNTLKERVKTMLNRPVPTTARLGLFGVLAIALTGTLLIPMARAAREGEREREEAAEVRRDARSAEMRELQEQMRALQQQMERMQQQMMRMHEERLQLEQLRRKLESAHRPRSDQEQAQYLKMLDELARGGGLEREKAEQLPRDLEAIRERGIDTAKEEARRRRAEQEREAYRDYMKILSDRGFAGQRDRPPRDVPPVPAMPSMPAAPMPGRPMPQPLTPDMVNEMIGRMLPQIMEEMLPRVMEGSKELAALQQEKARLTREVEETRNRLERMKRENKSDEETREVRSRLDELEKGLQKAEQRAERQAAEFERGMKEWGEQFGKRMEQWGKEFGEQYGKSMEMYGREMERWSERREERAHEHSESPGRERHTEGKEEPRAEP